MNTWLCKTELEGKKKKQSEVPRKSIGFSLSHYIASQIHLPFILLNLIPVALIADLPNPCLLFNSFVQSQIHYLLPPRTKPFVYASHSILQSFLVFLFLIPQSSFQFSSLPMHEYTYVYIYIKRIVQQDFCHFFASLRDRDLEENPSTTAHTHSFLQERTQESIIP